MAGGFVFSEKPIRIARGEGPFLYDESDTEYLDAGASYACAPLGHCPPAVVDAATDQLKDLLYVQGSYPVTARDDLYDRLARVGPGDCDNVWLCNSGTEANEAALKFARSATGRSKIVATMQGFHGRTMGALAATWKDEYRQGYEPLAGDFEFVPYGDEDALADAVEEETAAVILEPVQGEGGINPAPEGYLAAAREATADAGAALILDEIQTGLGRTGTFWASEAAGVEPDILTSAKGIASGLPLGATLCADWIADNVGSHGSTFSGGPVVCAAANATLAAIEDRNLPAHAASVGETLVERISAALGDEARDVRGNGLMVGIEVRRGSNRILRDLALEQQVLALPAGRTVVRLLPPLVIEEDHAVRLADALAACVQ